MIYFTSLWRKVDDYYKYKKQLIKKLQGWYIQKYRNKSSTVHITTDKVHPKTYFQATGNGVGMHLIHGNPYCSYFYIFNLFLCLFASFFKPRVSLSWASPIADVLLLLRASSHIPRPLPVLGDMAQYSPNQTDRAQYFDWSMASCRCPYTSRSVCAIPSTTLMRNPS